MGDRRRQHLQRVLLDVDRATGEGYETRVGNRAYVMSTVKISHDSTIGDGAVVVTGFRSEVG